ncbi:unnamed protein product [Darwinula stevensoni]|uniref:Uncharacterized protein n=1 Tax=Darwinula stevensoni TaxID=69355 RepID=A0A7R9A7Z9_9CRUS|nr:unnamed protein product [Darwinula stevensoni]CAG0895846.1 unnamed protein product [Darwinula stevensoni]
MVWMKRHGYSKRPRLSSGEDEDSNDVLVRRVDAIGEDVWGEELPEDEIEQSLLLASQVYTQVTDQPQEKNEHHADLQNSKKETWTGRFSKTKSENDIKVPVLPQDTMLHLGKTGRLVHASSMNQLLVTKSVKVPMASGSSSLSISKPTVFSKKPSASSPRKHLESKVPGRTGPQVFTNYSPLTKPSSFPHQPRTGGPEESIRKQVDCLKEENYARQGELTFLRGELKKVQRNLEQERLGKIHQLESQSRQFEEEKKALQRELDQIKTELELKNHETKEAIERCRRLEHSGGVLLGAQPISSPKMTRPSKKKSDFPTVKGEDDGKSTYNENKCLATLHGLEFLLSSLSPDVQDSQSAHLGDAISPILDTMVKLWNAQLSSGVIQKILAILRILSDKYQHPILKNGSILSCLSSLLSKRMDYPLLKELLSLFGAALSMRESHVKAGHDACDILVPRFCQYMKGSYRKLTALQKTEVTNGMMQLCVFLTSKSPLEPCICWRRIFQCFVWLLYQEALSSSSSSVDSESERRQRDMLSRSVGVLHHLLYLPVEIQWHTETFHTLIWHLLQYPTLTSQRMQERKFSRGLSKPGMAAQLREQVSQVLRQSDSQVRIQHVDPVDYENFILKHRTLLLNDPERDLLIFPTDDISFEEVPRKCRTTMPSVTEEVRDAASSLFVKECLKSYTEPWKVIQYKFSAYSGSYLNLPKFPEVSACLRDEVYEVDVNDEEMDNLSISSQAVTKEGYLLKGPESGNDWLLGNIATKSFKRRYACLRQGVDGTYLLEFKKDERLRESKGAIVLDFCQEIVRNTKRGRFAFELRMAERHKSYVLAAESEMELQDWVDKINRAIQAKRLEENRAASIERGMTPPPVSDGEGEGWSMGTLRGLEHSLNPVLTKYAHETECSIATARKELRQNLFAIYPDMPKIPCDEPPDLGDLASPWEEHFGVRFLVHCKKLLFKLNSELEPIEPYFTSLALYDARNGIKLSEDFHFCLNPPEVMDMLDIEQPPGSPISELLPHLKDAPSVTKALFSVRHPHPDIFLVLRVEKVLQGNILMASEPYVKFPDPRNAVRIHKIARGYCQRLGQYHMPFAWAAAQIFHLNGKLDEDAKFSPLYRQDTLKVSDADLLKNISEMRKMSDKQNRWTVIPGGFHISITPVQDPPPNSLTSSLQPLDPFPLPLSHALTLEVDNFPPTKAELSYPHLSYVNHLHVYPLSLKYDSQKTFTRARNIACVIELRDSDEEKAQPLQRIYGHSGEDLLTTQCCTPVLHHVENPEFYEEVKVLMPPGIHGKHHLLFTFHHVSCEPPKGNKKPSSVDSIVGYAWLPLLHKGRLVFGECSLPVSANLPPKYLAVEALGLGKGVSPDVKWVDGQKQLFSVKLDYISTVMTPDPHLHNFFTVLEQLIQSSSDTNILSPKTDLKSLLSAESVKDLSKYVKALHAADICWVLRYLQPLLHQLLCLLAGAFPYTSEELQGEVIKVLIHIIHSAEMAGHQEVILSYAKYVFDCDLEESSSPRLQTTLHEEMVKAMTLLLRPANTDLLIINKFMRHSGFFLRLLAKAMARYLLLSGRIKRHERFAADFLYRLRNFVQVLTPHILQKFKELPLETREVNFCLAQFLKKCLSQMDREYVFKLISSYTSKFSPGDPPLLQEYKLDFLREVLSHEHYVPLNLPIVTTRRGEEEDLSRLFTLSMDFCSKHFLSGLLLREVRLALNELPNVRRVALNILRNLLAKHSFDDRYSSAVRQSRIALLYLPLLPIILENVDRFDVEPKRRRTDAGRNILRNRGSYRSLPTGEVSEPEKKEKEKQSKVTEAKGNEEEDEDDTPTPTGTPSSSRSSSRRHRRMESVAMGTIRQDKLSPNEVRDLLLCFLWVVKSATAESLIAWWKTCSAEDMTAFFRALELSLHQFRYQGRSKEDQQVSRFSVYVERGMSGSLQIQGSNEGHLVRSSTMPARFDSEKASSLPLGSPLHSQPKRQESLAPSELDSMFHSLMEANLATEVGLIVLDALGLYKLHFPNRLSMDNGQNSAMKKFLDISLYFLQVSQSETLLKHVFAMWRAFINKFSQVLFTGSAEFCGKLCYELLMCCNSKLPSTRSEASSLLYLLLRSNFEFTKRKGVTRVHLQIVISVSKLLGEVVSLNNNLFQESLSRVNSYAAADKAMQKTAKHPIISVPIHVFRMPGFRSEVQDVTRRVRTVLMATSQLREHDSDPETLAELQHSLANSYASTPELRVTWLESLAKLHGKTGNFSEVAMCQVHIAAVMAEFLRLRGVFPEGARAFERLSPNVPLEECGLKDDQGMPSAAFFSRLQEVPYSEDTFIAHLELCASCLEKSERWECLGPLYRIIIPFYEKRRDFTSLSNCYGHLERSYRKVHEVNRLGRRFLGTYFRLAFYGEVYFEALSGQEFIYKEPNVTTLAEFSERIENQFGQKFGADSLRIIKDSNPVNEEELESRYAYIQITSVLPYFDPSEDRITEFERNHNVKRFVYETPFSKGEGKAAQVNSVADQWKRRTIVTTSVCLPYLEKRIQIVAKQVEELSPIEVAIEEMAGRVKGLHKVLEGSTIDVKKLQLILQGSISVQVNAGPIAYAKAFLSDENAVQYPANHVARLMDLYREFIDVCEEALETNGRLIGSEQNEYQEALKTSFYNFLDSLRVIVPDSALFGDEGADTNLLAKRSSTALFNMISGTASTIHP